MAAHEIRAGRLVEILERYHASPMPISVVYPSARRFTPRLRVLIEALSAAGAVSFTAVAQPKKQTRCAR